MMVYRHARIRRWRLGAAAAAAFAALTAALAPSAAAQPPYAPVNRPGPALAIPARALARSLVCTGVRHGGREPVLLVPGTTLTPQPNFGWNYERALAALHVPYCTVELPLAGDGDVQVAGEFVVNAIRVVHRLSGRKVQILGYSQGGMVPRWALRFWPDTRALVDDLVGLDPSNHGTEDSQVTCQSSCPPSFWQQASGSHFTAALNSFQETFGGISYTVVYSHADEVVTPNLDASGSSSLHGGGGSIANIAVQQICPADTSDHLAMGTYDPVGYALAIDALTHPGPAIAARIPATVCAQPFQPGVDPASFPADYASFLEAIGSNAAASPRVSQEPPLACYVFAPCDLAPVKHHTRARRRRRAHRRHARRHRHGSDGGRDRDRP